MPKPGIKFGSVAQQERYPFISGDELSDIERFTVTGVRLIPGGRFGAQYYFDVAFKDSSDAVQRFCFTCDANAEREEMANLVRKQPVTGVRLDVVATRNGNRYFKMVDADQPRQSLDSQLALGDNEDNDIPF